MVALLALILCLNAGISYWNAYVCGKSWEESKAVGGPIRFLVWCGAIQSAIGFSSVLILPLIFLAHVVVPDYFTDVYFNGAINLWYLTIIFPALGTGFAIMIESWVAAYRDRSLLSIGGAAWNTFAQVHNTMGAVENIGSAFGSVKGAFASVFEFPSDSDDAKAKAAIIGLATMVAIVVIALMGGAFITAAIIHRYAGTVPLPNRASMPGGARAA
jgi:hypothetical protein